MQFSKFQHKITGKLCGAGNILGQHRVEDTVPLQAMLKF